MHYLFCLFVCVATYATIGEVNGLEDGLSEVENAGNGIEDRLNKVENAIEGIADRLSKVENAIEDSCHHAAESAAFTVRLNDNYWPRPGAALRFEHVVVNQGGHFNSSSYVFTCPKHGLYMFSFSIYSHRAGGTEVNLGLSASLVLDGVSFAEVLTRNDDPVYQEHQQAATTAVVDCPAGGKVWVQSWSNLMRVWGRADIPRCVFTGYAIFYF